MSERADHFREDQQLGAPADAVSRGIPSQPGIPPGHNSLNKFKVRLARPNGASIHGALLAVGELEAMSMINPLKGWTVASLKRIGRFEACFWDEEFMCHIASEQKWNRANFEIAVYPGADPGTFEADLTRTRPNAQLLCRVKGNSPGDAFQLLFEHVVSSHEKGGLR
jgi:hypothetical protein